MRWMFLQRLSIKQRTVLGFTLMVLLVLGGSGTGLLFTRSVERTVGDMHRGAEQIELIENLKDGSRAVVATIDNMLLTRQMGLIERRLKGDLIYFNQQLTAFRVRYEDDSLPAMSKNGGLELGLLSLGAELERIVDKLMAIVKKGRWAHAQFLRHNDLASLERRFMEKTFELGADIRNHVDQSVADSIRSQRLLRTYWILTALASLCLGPLAAFLTVVSIIRPINALVSNVRAISEGNLSRNAEGFGRDEIGALATAFNTMTARLKHRIEMDMIVADISREFIELGFESTDEAIHRALARVGSFVGADRSYVFQYSEEKRVMSNSHEWCDKGIEPQMARLQKLPVDSLPWFTEQMSQLKTVHVPSVANLPQEARAEKKEWQEEGIQSLVCFPMVYGRNLCGFVGFDAVRQKRSWSKEDILLLRLLGEIFSSTLERKRANETLERSETKYRSLFDDALDMIHIIDSKGIIIDANPIELTTMGYTREEYLGKPLIEMIYPDYRSVASETIKKVLSGRIVEGHETAMVTKHGGRIDIEVNAVPRVSDGTIVGVRAISRNITERKQAELVKNELESQLRQAHKMEAIGVLAGGIAHDFNNILGIIIGNLELATFLLERKNAAHSNLDKALQACMRAKDMVNQILAFSRQEENQLKPIDIKPILKEVIKLIRASIPTTINIQQSITIEKAMILGDPTQIHQILINLCTNAAQAMEKMGSLLQLGLASVHIDTDCAKEMPELATGKYIRLTVSDNGHGIGADILGKVFDPYFTTKEVGTGTGMGLSVVHGIVKDHGGTIRVYSEEDKGTTFHVFLPELEKDHNEETVTSEELPTGNESILLVDDEAALTDIGAQMLESLGYKVEAKTSALEALQIFRKEPAKFDIVVSDMTMPNMTGEILAKEFMAIRTDIPIVLCTGFSHEMDEKKAKELGIKRFVMKPFIRGELAHTIRQALDEE